MESLKDLLKTQPISLTTEKAMDGQVGHKENGDLLKPQKSLNQQNTCGCRLVWFRTLAFQANDPGFKSRRPHQSPIILPPISALYRGGSLGRATKGPSRNNGSACGLRHNQPATQTRRRNKKAIYLAIGWLLLCIAGFPQQQLEKN
jgi:hypothetical protein